MACSSQGQRTDDVVDPSFFISQTAKLDILLDRLVTECQSVKDPDALVAYMEAVDIISTLAEETRFCSFLTTEQLQVLELDVRRLVEKIYIVEVITGGPAASQPVLASESRKRRRSLDCEEATGTVKRRRGSEDMVSPDATKSIMHVEDPEGKVMPSIEYSPDPWWTDPFYD